MIKGIATQLLTNAEKHLTLLKNVVHLAKGDEEYALFKKIEYWQGRVDCLREVIFYVDFKEE